MTSLLLIAALAASQEAAPAVARAPAADSVHARSADVRTPVPPRRYTVVVDAGHGGQDPGMRGWMPSQLPFREKDVTLAVSMKLARELERRGVTVLMTRTTDTFIALSDRGRIANDNRGDIFISIHVNAANPQWRNPSAARGFETYFLSEAKTEDERRVAAMENDADRFVDGPAAARDDALGFILSDMRQNEHLRESNDLAETIQSRLERVHPGPSRGVQQAPFRVLVTAFMPAVLVEIGFGTNRSEAAFIAGAEGQRVISVAVADAVMAYFAHYERRVGGASRTAREPRE